MYVCVCVRERERNRRSRVVCAPPEDWSVVIKKKNVGAEPASQRFFVKETGFLYTHIHTHKHTYT